MSDHLTVLIASPDHDYLRLARTVLRIRGHIVFTTSVGPDRLRRQVSLRWPDVVLLDCDANVLTQAHASLTALGVAVLRVVDDPAAGASPSRAPIGKWVPATALVDAVARAGDERTAAGRPHLRLVGSP